MARDKEKQAARYKAWREANKEKLAAQRKAWGDANKEKLAACRKAWGDANKEKQAAQKRACERAAIDKMSDRYVTRVLIRDGTLTSGQVTPQLIELKRLQLQIHRATKTLTQTLKEKE